MSKEQLAEDLAYVRSVAEEGRQTPLLGGRYLMFWGALNALAFVAHWSLLSQVWPDPQGVGFGVLWLTYGLVAAVGMFLLSRASRRAPGRTSANNRVHRAAWFGAVIALCAIVGGDIARLVIDRDFTAPNGIMGSAFACYGAVMFVTAAISGQRWLFQVAGLAAIAAAIAGAFANETWIYLFGAGASLIVLFAPGLRLASREPSAAAA
jgi:hypothetical protein